MLGLNSKPSLAEGVLHFCIFIHIDSYTYTPIFYILYYLYGALSCDMVALYGFYSVGNAAVTFLLFCPYFFSLFWPLAV